LNKTRLLRIIVIASKNTIIKRGYCKKYQSGFIMPHFYRISEPINLNKRHKLIDIISIAICAVICGVNSCEHIEVFGLSKPHWFKDFLQLPHDIPSHVTFGRVFAQIDPDEFQRPLRIFASLFLLQFSIQHSIRINNASRLHSPLRFRPQAVL
jgi:hypothetical protein